MLVQRGYKDAYRVIHPDPVKCPGFTFPADNKSVIPENLSWAPEADERERIDFVYYYPNKNLQIKSAQIVGPTGSIVRGQRIEEQTKDPIIPPVNNQWYKRS
ncbi:hypothetical protein NXV02_07050 [Bacteroides ovatus]|nr:hypothetical protein [Bacteroides ovatus]